VLLLVAVLAFGAWLWPQLPSTPPKPTIYAVRVQVLDPHGQPVRDSTIRASAGNEPHLLPDGWWQVEIPEAKAPIDGQVSLWAVHNEWEGGQASLILGEDPNPQVQIRLRQPQAWIRGRVVDGNDRLLQGVQVSRQDGTPGEATTDEQGRFALELSVPRETRVRLRSEYKSWPPGDDFCYAGRDTCWIVLEKR
jgi:hypothetical protein